MQINNPFNGEADNVDKNKIFAFVHLYYYVVHIAADVFYGY